MAVSSSLASQKILQYKLVPTLSFQQNINYSLYFSLPLSVSCAGLSLTKEMKSFNFFGVLILMLFCSILFAVEARPLNGASIYYLSLNAVKAGPSPGAGHKFTDAKTLGGIKDSGPSPSGDGHKFTNAKTLGGIKNSGPSPGEGNKFTNAYTHGGVKKSGPSPGDGH